MIKPRLVPLYLLALLCSSCALFAAKRLYPGPERPIQEVAIILPRDGATASFYQATANGGGDGLQLVGSFGKYGPVALLPGEYKAVVRYLEEEKRKVYDPRTKAHITQTTTKYSTTPSSIRFSVEAGKEYLLEVRHSSRTKWQAAIVDRESNKTVSEKAKVL